MQPIRLATPRDLNRIVSLARSESNAIGFIPQPGLLDYITHGRCFVATHSSRVVAYVLGRPSMRYARWCRPITHLVVHEDFRRQHIATRLLTAVAQAARVDGQTALQAWTRTNLQPAIAMWAEYSWDLICERKPDTADAIPLQLWRHQLTAVAHPDYRTVPPVAGYRAARMTTAVRTAPARDALEDQR